MDQQKLTVKETRFKGFYEIELIVHGDSRGWFKENYQRAKLEDLGLPQFEIVQNNISFNTEKGVTRGLHAEPWDKFISLASGRALGVWVDLRPGATYGQSLTIELSPQKAVFVPRGVANGYQTLETNTAYTYLVNDLWAADKKYQALSLADPDLAIDWPIPLGKAIISEKDLKNPLLKEIEPMDL